LKGGVSGPDSAGPVVRIRIGNTDLDPGRQKQNSPQKKIKLTKFKVLKCLMFSLKDWSIFCSLETLYGRPKKINVEIFSIIS
jgi:hypothetical protein